MWEELPSIHGALDFCTGADITKWDRWLCGILWCFPYRVGLHIDAKKKTIQGCMRASQSRWKSYADNRSREFEFNVSEHVFWKYYRLRASWDLSREGNWVQGILDPSAICPVFHVSMFQKYLPNDLHVLQSPTIEVNSRRTYVERPIAILNQ